MCCETYLMFIVNSKTICCTCLSNADFCAQSIDVCKFHVKMVFTFISPRKWWWPQFGFNPHSCICNLAFHCPVLQMQPRVRSCLKFLRKHGRPEGARSALQVRALRSSWAESQLINGREGLWLRSCTFVPDTNAVSVVTSLLICRNNIIWLSICFSPFPLVLMPRLGRLK